MQPFADRLLAWFDAHKRDLPWRATKDPWAIWVSEVMLQQTRVEAVRHIYPGFMQHYPSPGHLATVGDDELLAAWRGLGYYRRARMLRKGAQVVMERHAGQVPDDPGQLLDLPGIGPYTRGAVASIAFDLPELAVDGNVERVAARHRGIREVVKAGAGARQVRDVVTAWQERTRPGDFNQALMELGATVCTPRTPRCDHCPVTADCVARKHSLQDQLPTLPARRPSVDVHARAVLITTAGHLVVGCRVAEGEVNAGQVDLPGPGILVSHDGGAALAAVVAREFGIRCDVADEATTVRHGITHHRIRLTAHWARCDDPIRAPLLSASPADPRVPWTTTARKVFQKLGLTAAGA